MKAKSFLYISIVICTILALSLSSAMAQESNAGKNWEFNLTPLYLWGISIEGDTTLGDTQKSTKADFSEIFDSLEGVFSLNFNVMHRSNFGLMLDFLYLDIKADKEAGPGTGFELGLKTIVSQLAGTYRFGSEKHAFDALAGIRYLDLEVDVEFDMLPLADSRKKDFVDPIIGGRYTWQIADKWALKLYGDIGGFGVGSDFTWQALGLIDFWPWQHVGFLGGYRALSYQFEEDKGPKTFELDLGVHGPILGVSFRW